MCGRYSAELKKANIEKNFGALKSRVELNPRYNIAPSQEAPVIFEAQGRQLALFQWGLVPGWAKEPAIGYKMINARADTIREKPSYKRPFEKSRCLVVGDGFFEWRQGPGAKKRPFRVVLKSREPFAMAGIWDVWKKSDGAPLRSFAIVTTDAAEKLKVVHDRMPVILSREAQEVWLDPKSDPQKLHALLKPYPDDQLDFYEVSSLVNKPQNDRSEIIQPIPQLLREDELF